MATSSPVDYLYCSICLEIFHTPRTLPCLHSFCQSCLTGYIQKISEKPGKTNLFCPICRSDTKTDNVKFKLVEKWVENFPINFTLLSILNERKFKMEQMTSNCEPCLREEVKVKAIVYCFDCSEKLCVECKRQHTKFKSLSKHKLVDTKEISEGKLNMTELEYFENLSKCPKHSTEEVKYLCKDHDQLCCNECAIVTHRKCEDLVSLADEVGKKSGNDGEIRQRFERVESYTMKLIEHEVKFKLNLETNESKVKEDLRVFKANIDEAFKYFEHRILSEISTRKSALSKVSSIQKESAEQLKNDIRQSAEKLRKASDSTVNTNVQTFLLEREMAKVVKKYEGKFTELRQQSSKRSVNLVEVQSAQEAVEVLNNVYRIEETTTEESHLPSLAETKDFKQREMTLIQEFEIMKNQPRYCVWIGDYIVITFYSDSNIYAYRAADGSLISSYSCQPPTALTAFENDEFAVALPTLNRIDVMKVTQNKLTYVRVLANTKTDVITYSSLNKHLFSLSMSEEVIRKFTLYGRDAGLINLSSIERAYIQNAYNIFFDEKCSRLFISSHGLSKLLCVDLKGTLVFQHGIQQPWSVITDTEGNVYVASYSGQCIKQLDKDGRFLREIIPQKNGINNPMAMSFNKQMDKLVVTLDGNPKRMKIYQFK